MNARKLLVATALSILTGSGHTTPAVATTRVTGNVVTGQGKGGDQKVPDGEQERR